MRSKRPVRKAETPRHDAASKWGREAEGTELFDPAAAQAAKKRHQPRGARREWPRHRAFLREAITTAGAQFFLLPPYSPDMNPIEMAFAKLKTLLRQARTNPRWPVATHRHLARPVHQFTPEERAWDPLESTCRHASLSIL